MRHREVRVMAPTVLTSLSPADREVVEQFEALLETQLKEYVGIRRLERDCLSNEAAAWLQVYTRPFPSTKYVLTL